MAAELGVGIYRFNYNPATLDEIEYLDYVVKLCKAYGLKMMLVMDNSAQRLTATDTSPPKRPLTSPPWPIAAG